MAKLQEASLFATANEYQRFMDEERARERAALVPEKHKEPTAALPGKRLEGIPRSSDTFYSSRTYPPGVFGFAV